MSIYLQTDCCQINVCVSLQGMVLTWDNYRLDTYVQKLADAVFNHQEKVGIMLGNSP